MACEEGWSLQQKFNESVLARVEAEANLNTGKELFSEKWDAFKIAEDQWYKSLYNRYEHIAHCPNCFPNPPS